MSDWDRERLIDVGGSQDGDDSPVNTRVGDGTVRNQSDLTSGQAEEQTPEGPVTYTTQLATLLITVNVSVGVGLLALPYALQTSGLVTSLIVQLVFLVTIVSTCIMSTEMTLKAGVDSYHRMIQTHCHPFVYQFAQVSLLCIVFGTTVAYIVIIGDQADRVFASLYGPTFCYTWYMNRRFIMSAITVFAVKPLCCAKTVEFLKYGSFAGLLSIGFVMYVVVSEFIKVGHIAEDVNYLPKDWTDVGFILPVFCLSYQCHLSLVPTVATTRKQEKYTSYFTVTVAMVLATAIYMFVSILAALTFGSKVQSDLTESYPGKSWPILTTIAIVALKCIVTLPPVFLPARLSLVDIVSAKSSRFNELSDSMKRISVTYVTLTLALVLALFVPDILVAVDILGCLSVMFIFTLPALSYLNLIKSNRLMKQQSEGLNVDVPVYSMKDKFKRALSHFLIVFGFMMMSLVLYKSIQKIVSDTPSPALCHKP